MGISVARTRSNTEIGRIGEYLAREHLMARGYVIVESNWRCAAGEIDLVARDGSTWAFVEVKTRRSDRFGTPEEAITPAKQRRLLDCGLAYVAEHDLGEVEWRIDVVSIRLERGGAPGEIRVYQHAVSDNGSF